MYKRLLLLLAVLFLGLTLVSCSKDKNSGEEGMADDHEDAYAMVEGVEIKKDEFEKLFSIWEMDYGEEFISRVEQGTTVRNMLRNRLLNDCILGLCYENYYVSKDMALKDAELSEKLEQYKGGLKKSGDRLKTFEEKGITDDILRNELKRNHYSLKYMHDLESELRGNYKLGDDEFYNSRLTVKVRQILVDDEKLAEEIREKLLKGAKFEELMKKHSKDKASIERGGELGTLKYEDMPVDFSSYVFNMSVGEISKPIKTVFGYHIVELMGGQTVRQRDDEELLDKPAISGIKEELFQRHLAEELNKRQAEFLNSDDIEIFGSVNVEK